MTTQEAKDIAAKEAGYPSWENAVYLLNEEGLCKLTDKALELLSINKFKEGMELGQKIAFAIGNQLA